MNNRERVLASLDHRQSDKTPYNIGFTEKAYAKMAAYYGDPEFASRLGNCLTSLSCEPEPSWREVKPDVWEDQFGVWWDRTIDKDIGTPCNRMITPETLDDYQFPDPDDPSRYAGYTDILAEKGERFFVVVFGFTLFERAWTLIGMENLMTAMLTDKPFVHELMDRILDFNLKIIDNVCAHPVDAILFGDDWGMQTGLLMGPRLWHEFIESRIRQMYSLTRSKGKFVFIHSCGKVDELFPTLIDCGVDVFNPLQPEVMDVFGVKQRYGNDLSFYGGISVQRSLPYSTPAAVRDEVQRLLEVVGRDGGYIASPSHAIPADAKPENIAAMIEVLQNQ